VIGSLSGVVQHIDGDGLLLSVAGVGYQVAMTSRSLEQLSGSEGEVTIFTHLHVREDVLALYGFTSPLDRQLFRTLISASGVGPKVGLAVLSAMTADDVRVAVVGDDADAFTVVPGIGKRTAQKLVLELRPKLAAMESEIVGAASEAGQVRMALESLGFTGSEIAEALQSVDRSAPVGEQVRQALKQRDGAS
jgi:Holliday junction DNA helicase RuvA